MIDGISIRIWIVLWAIFLLAISGCCSTCCDGVFSDWPPNYLENRV